jgi:hypothetical protein
VAVAFVDVLGVLAGGGGLGGWWSVCGHCVVWWCEDV